MPTKIKIIHAHDFIKVTPDGVLDFEESEKLIKEIASLITPEDDYMILLDTRTVHSILLPIQLWYLTLEISKSGEQFRKKTAVVCPRERFEQAKFLELCAENRGLHVQAFTSYEHAIDWLCFSTKAS